MDEDIKNELLAILRELKEGASPAFQALVEQRSLYYGSTILSGLVLLVVGLLAGWALLAYGKRNRRAIEDAEIMPLGVAIIGGIVSTVMAVSGLGIAVANLPDYVAPLGRVLEMLR